MTNGDSTNIAGCISQLSAHNYVVVAKRYSEGHEFIDVVMCTQCGDVKRIDHGTGDADGG